MRRSLMAFLTERRADTETVQQAARYYLAERTGDLSPEEMRDRLVKAARDVRAAEDALRTLERDPRALENASLALLSCAWADPSEVERVRGAIEEAKGKLPVLEAATLAIVAMYGMYLVVTGGVRKREAVVERGPDGTLRETTTTEYFGPAGPLSAVVNLFRGGTAE